MRRSSSSASLLSQTIRGKQYPILWYQGDIRVPHCSSHKFPSPTSCDLEYSVLSRRLTLSSSSFLARSCLLSAPLEHGHLHEHLLRLLGDWTDVIYLPPAKIVLLFSSFPGMISSGSTPQVAVIEVRSKKTRLSTFDSRLSSCHQIPPYLL